MKNKEFSPQDSLQLINSVIQDARYRFMENGFIYLFWGGLVFFAAMGQFILLQMEKYSISYYPYFIMPLGFIFTGIYYSRKNKRKSSTNRIFSLITTLWMVVGLNIMILGFVFPQVLRSNLIPLILVFSSIGVIISGKALENKTLMVAGVFGNIAGFLCFWVPPGFQPLVLALTTLMTTFLPGLLLRKKYLKRNDV